MSMRYVLDGNVVYPKTQPGEVYFQKKEGIRPSILECSTYKTKSLLLILRTNFLFSRAHVYGG